ncbi:MAG: hypothetical protein ACYTEW_17870 [Planctomycetota bacterium]|jgi:hypothetical protein
MKKLREELFEHSGKQFVLRVFVEKDYYKVIAFLGNEQVSPVYSVHFTTHHDFFVLHEGDLIEGLLDLARKDIQRGIYFKGNL